MCSREGGSPSPVGARWNRQEMGPRLRGGTPVPDYLIAPPLRSAAIFSAS
jgi:hypothetical protein